MKELSRLISKALHIAAYEPGCNRNNNARDIRGSSDNRNIILSADFVERK